MIFSAPTENGKKVLTMAEYIEREATVKLLRSLGSRDYRREKGTIQEAIKMVSFSEYTPAADVAPVRHGRWKRTTDGAALCTSCKRKMNPSQYGYAFCGLCGAKMDGGED